MEIREAQIADAAAIARVHVDTWRTAYRGIVPDDYLDGLSYSQREQWWRSQISDPKEAQCIYVAQDDEGVVGFALGGRERSGDPGYDGELYAIYVLEGRQRKGVGRLLVSQVARSLSRLGMASMLVWVLAANPSRGFYQRLGGQPVAEQTIRIGGVDLTEVAYGWTDINALVGMAAGPPV